MEYLGFDVGSGWWKAAASKVQPLQDMQIHDDSKKGLYNVRSFVVPCNFHRRHIQNFTCSPAPLTDLIKKSTPWIWTSGGEECFHDLRKEIASSDYRGVPRPKDEIIPITGASDLEVGGLTYQWQELNPAELTHRHYCTSGWNRDCCLDYNSPSREWRPVPLWSLELELEPGSFQPRHLRPRTPRICWCSPHDPNCWDPILSSSYVTCKR